MATLTTEDKRILEIGGSITFIDKYTKVILKPSPRKSGYLASTYFRDGGYIGCKHIACNELENFIKYQLDDYKSLSEIYI